jgi:hypothetical protein
VLLVLVVRNPATAQIPAAEQSTASIHEYCG